MAKRKASSDRETAVLARVSSVRRRLRMTLRRMSGASRSIVGLEKKAADLGSAAFWG